MALSPPSGEPHGDASAILARLRRKTQFDITATPLPGEDRSPHCMRVVTAMVHAGLTDDEIKIVTAASQNGIFGRYHSEGKDLDAEIRRARERVASDHVRQPPSADKGEFRNDRRPTIQVAAGEIESTVDDAERALIDSNCGIYQRGNLIVTVGASPQVAADGAKVDVARIFECGEHALRERLASVANFQKYDARSNAVVVCDPPMSIVKTLQQRSGRLRLPILRGVINAPTLRADGSLLNQPGYDRRTCLLFEPGGAQFPLIPDRPTRADAERALAALHNLIGSFPFTSATDRAVALSMILTACIRPSLSAAPLHAFTAPVAGAGKSKLVDIASVIATGRPAGVIAQGRTEEEFEKRLGALLLAGDAIIAIDNCESLLGGEFLCQVLTQPVARIRILGRSETPELPTGVLVTATGNNLVLVGDLTRRAILCRLDPQHERPELRTFDREPVTYAKARRTEFVTAALTILRAYHVAGRPPQGRAPFGSFEEWSDFVRGALLWLGTADPVDSISAIRSLDPKLDNLRTTLTLWHATLGDAPTTVTAAIAAARKAKLAATNDDHAQTADLHEALLAIAGQNGAIDGRRLGKWLGANEGRPVADLKFERAGMRQNFTLWRVVALPLA